MLQKDTKTESSQLCVGMTVMAKVFTTLEICENAKLARDLALTGGFLICFLYDVYLFVYL